MFGESESIEKDNCRLNRQIGSCGSVKGSRGNLMNVQELSGRSSIELWKIFAHSIAHQNLITADKNTICQRKKWSEIA